MEVGTVIDIVEMMSNRIKYAEDKIDSTSDRDTKTFYLGYKQALLDLSNHLQDGIESQLNAWENRDEGY